ncbi:hypothetical protein LDENG_00118240 [Lucifuga dentata]|nr:hypothetical protein LDENG_00118240 [Lucifuga dentata]
MDADGEVERILYCGNGVKKKGGKKQEKWKRPPSSYGSMKSDSDEEIDEDIAEACLSPVALTQFEIPAPKDTGLQLICCESPETIYTMTTQQTRPPGAMVIDTRSFDLVELSKEDEEEEEDEILFADSPEPPEPVESDEAMQTETGSSQPGRLHPEQDLPHIFKSIQNTLTGLTWEELHLFKIQFLHWEQAITPAQVMEGDVLDFVDRIIEVLGQDRALLHTIHTLKSVNKTTKEEELRKQCDRALIRLNLKQHLIREHRFICEGVPRQGKQNDLDTIYVEPQISTCGLGGVHPSHELRPHPPSPLQVPAAETFVELNSLFRLCKENGQPVRTVVTTGIPGIGMSVSVGKFCLDWTELRANRDLQFVIKLSFRNLWYLRNKNLPPSKMSIMEVIEYNHPECKNMKYLEEADCKFLIIMDSFDCYQAALDWKNSPVISDSYTQAHPDVLIVNLIRGNLLPGAFVWVLGRRAAISQIPAELTDVITEIQGFSNEMKDEYLTRRFRDQALAANIVAHYQRLPTLRILCHQPFVCWMVATVFERCFSYQGYGANPPKLTPFYINILVVQTYRKLQFYYERTNNDLKWSRDDKQMLMNLGRMALKMLERNTSVFFEEDLKEHSLKLPEVTVFSGLCTELPTAPSNGKRKFCFVHLTFQEFMAALYVFEMFYVESKNVLDSWLAKSHTHKHQTKSAAGLIQSVLERTLSFPLGQYDMFLRFLCGLLCPDCHKKMLGGNLFQHSMPKVGGLEEVQQLLDRMIQSAPPERLANLKECLRELTQEDE